jgi:hypothetical protein
VIHLVEGLIDRQGGRFTAAYFRVPLPDLLELIDSNTELPSAVIWLPGLVSTIVLTGHTVAQ